jgi:hypothetical protein
MKFGKTHDVSAKMILTALHKNLQLSKEAYQVGDQNTLQGDEEGKSKCARRLWL